MKMHYSSYYDKRRVVVLSSPPVKHSIPRRSGCVSSIAILIFIVSYMVLFLAVFHLYFAPSCFHDKQHISLPVPLIHTPALPSFTMPTIPWEKIPKFFEKKQLHSDEMPVYYINLDSAKDRKEYISNHLQDMGFHNVHHVSAWTPEDVRNRVQMKVVSLQNMMRPNDRETSCIASHLYAMYLAINDTSNTSPYAMIVEDDVRFPFAIDWKSMVEEAPKDFAILQLTTSNSDAQQDLLTDYRFRTRDSLHRILSKKTPVRAHQNEDNQKSTKDALKSIPLDVQLNSVLSDHQWAERDWRSTLWSTQGYIIQKAKLQQMIRSMVEEVWDKDEKRMSPQMKIQPIKSIPCRHSPCIVPFRMVADIYLYTQFTPTYISRIPLLNGELETPDISTKSSIQTTKSVTAHVNAFQAIDSMIETIRKNGTVLSMPSAASAASSSPSSFLRLFMPSKIPSITVATGYLRRRMIPWNDHNQNEKKTSEKTRAIYKPPSIAKTTFTASLPTRFEEWMMHTNHTLLPSYFLGRA